MRDFRRRGLNAPDGVGVYNETDRFIGDGARNLPRDVHVEFLKHLHAKDPSSLIPEPVEHPLCGLVFGFGVDIVGINQDIRIDERSIAHAVRPAQLELLRRGGNLLPEARSPAVRPVRKLLLLLREIRSAELADG
jgi:hypothetical protein